MSHKILITGGSGFIGSHLVDELLKREDHQLLVIDNFSTGRRDNLRPHPRLEIIEDSIVNADHMQQIFDRFKPHSVIHAAASYKNPDDWVEDSLTNAAGTAIILKNSMRLNVSRFIYFQTALCYGLKPQEQPISLAHPILPGDSSYAISKTAGEYYVQMSSLDWVTFRLANAYGPRNISGPLPTFFKRLTAGQPCFVMDTRRDFVFVDDMVTAVIRALDGKGQGTYHLSSGADYSIQELFHETVEALGISASAEVRPRDEDDVFSILLDPSRTQQDLQWRPETSLKEGVRRAIAYYQQFGIEQTFTHLRHAEKAST